MIVHFIVDITVIIVHGLPTCNCSTATQKFGAEVPPHFKAKKPCKVAISSVDMYFKAAVPLLRNIPRAF